VPPAAQKVAVEERQPLIASGDLESQLNDTVSEAKNKKDSRFVRRRMPIALLTPNRRAFCISLFTMMISIPALIGN
jgi:hypothetical protein